MKTPVQILLLIVVVGLVHCFDSHKKLTKAHKARKNQKKYRLKQKKMKGHAIMDAMNQLKMFLRSFKNKKANKLVMKQNGEYQISDQIASDFWDLCNDRSVKDPVKIEYLLKIGNTLSSFLPNYVKQTHYIYYVKTDIKNKGQCRTSNKLLGSQFMILDNDYPENINFNDQQQKIAFLKVCYNNGAPYVLQNCAFDPCTTTLEEDNKKLTEEQAQKAVGSANRNGNINGDCQFSVMDPSSNLDTDDAFSTNMWFKVNSLTNQGNRQDLGFHQIQPYGRSGLQFQID